MADSTDSVVGYKHAEYAKSLSEFGTPSYLTRCSGWVLERRVPGTSYLDGFGCYPLFACRDWSLLAVDLDEIGERWVSMALVTDPFGDFSVDTLRKTFPDVCIPFKDHYVVDLTQPPESFVQRHHRRNVRRGYKNVEVHRCEQPTDFLEDWIRLYAELKVRHDISGIAAFSPQSFRRQLGTPGLVAFRAVRDDRTVAMALWYVQDNVGYYHLGAADETGYELRAPFALFWHAIEHFAEERFAWLDLGGVAGVSDSASGLRRFKSGWSTGTREAYFCGRIMNRDAYTELAKPHGESSCNYFPIYRKGEFG